MNDEFDEKARVISFEMGFHEDGGLSQATRIIAAALRAEREAERAACEAIAQRYCGNSWVAAEIFDAIAARGKR